MSAPVRGMRLMVFVHYEANGSIFHVASTRPKPEEVEDGDLVVKQDVWIEDRYPQGAPHVR